MGHGYVRANYGDNCFYRDSSFKRYNRAHGDTTIFNFNYGNSYGCCGGSHGTGFWGGLGMGIGYNLGSWLMGGMNMLGGWLGMGNMGGFGNWFGGMNFGNIGGFGGGNWLSGTNTSTGSSSTKTETKTVEKTDSEYKAINSAREKLNELVGRDEKTPVTADDLKALDAQIKALTAKDGINDDDNKKQIDMLKADFEKLVKANPEAAKAAGLAETEKPDGAGNVDKTGAADGDDATKGANGSDGAAKGAKDPDGAEAGKTAENINKATTAEELEKALPEGGYDKLSDADKKAYGDKLTALLPNMTDDDKKALLEKALPTELKAKIKASFYVTGYTNYDGKTELKDGDVILAHDVSGLTKDTTKGAGKADSTITKSDNGSHPKTIVIHDRKDITYTYKETADGEYIYTSDQNKQDYVLQKGADGKFYLMQYAYHKGYGERDWS